MSDGTIFRAARVMEVRPDALILAHENGVAMAELAKLPKSIRSRYNYDPAKAAAYRERETTTRRVIAEEDSRLLATREERKMELSRIQMETHEAPAGPGADIAEVSFSYRASASDRAHAAAIERVGAEISRIEDRRTAASHEPKTFWTADFWQHPILQLLGVIMGGMGSGAGPGSESEPRGWR